MVACALHTTWLLKETIDSKARKCIFIGYPYGQKAYKLYDLETHSTLVSRDVIFFEQSFPYHNEQSIQQVYNPDFVSFGHDDVSPSVSFPENNNLPSTASSQLSPHTSMIHTFSSNSTHDSSSSPSHNSSILNSSSNPCAEHNSLFPSTTLPPIRHSPRKIIPSTKLFDFVNTYVHHTTIIQSISNSESQSFAVNSCQVAEPKYYHQAKKDPNWIEAMNKELQALTKNETWELTMLPEGKKAIGCKWVYKTKLNHDGTVERFKARLVAIGYQQVEGQDFTQNFSPVAMLATVRVVIALATIHQWHKVST